MAQASRCVHCGQVHGPDAARCPVTGLRLDAARYTQVNEDEVLVGSVLEERYVVKEVLGQGTTGTVFAVEHLVTGRPAAMKVLRARYVATDALLRVFHGEARAAFALPHPVLCEVFDAGTLPDGSPFLVMERLLGETLATRVAHERMSIGSAVDMMMQLLAGLDAVHARDMLVRDLRPQNIFLAHRRGCRPVVKILDFGLARLVPLARVQEDWDALRSVLGGSDAAGSLALPYYLSPERTRSEHGLGPQSDLFVAGVVFYEALTGHKPFVSTSFNGLLLQIAQAKPAPLGDFRGDVPPELDALVMRVLAQAPALRPSSAAELQDELRAVFERGRRSPSRPAPAGSSAPGAVSTSLPVAQPALSPVTPAAPIAPLRPPSSSGFAAVRASGSISAVPSAGPPTTQQRPGSSPSYSSIPVSATIPPLDGLGDAAVPDDPFEEQTRTDRNVHALLGDESQAMLARSDEASAESPLRTVPPPPLPVDVDIDVDVDELAGDTQKIRLARAGARDDDDETATMELTPEVRAKIDAMTRPREIPDPNDPEPSPHTRRMK